MFSPGDRRGKSPLRRRRPALGRRGRQVWLTATQQKLRAASSCSVTRRRARAQRIQQAGHRGGAVQREVSWPQPSASRRRARSTAD